MILITIWMHPFDHKEIFHMITKNKTLASSGIYEQIWKDIYMLSLLNVSSTKSNQ